jgi:ligand-binding sensor domain-containing protein/two-component sensor histidine kinase
MKKSIGACLLLAMLGTAGTILGASGNREYARRVWRTQDGLPENQIQAISQTRDGYLWIGTAGGLVRFDGARFTVYNRANAPGFVNDSVRALFCARDGSLWIGTDGGGLMRFQNGSFRSYGERQGLTNGYIKAILQDRRGRLWTSTAHGFFRLNGEDFVRIAEPADLTVSAFWEILEREDGVLWTRSTRGWYRVESERLTGEPRNSVDSLVPDSRCASRPPAGGLRYRDDSGDLWIGTNGYGLTRVHHCSLTIWRAPDDLPGDVINAIFQDRERSIWVGTEDGLLCLSQSTVVTLNMDDGFSENNLATAYLDRTGVIWITTRAHRVFRLLHGRVTPFTLPADSANFTIWTVFEDLHGALYLGTGGHGFFKIAAGSSVGYSTKQGLRNNTVTSFFEDQRGILWIGTSSGLSRWDGRRFRNYYLEDGLVYGYTRIVTGDRNGDVLVGTDYGVSRVHDDHIVSDPLLIRAGREKIYAIHVDGSGAIWLGTRGAGLIRIGNGKVCWITTHFGLLSNSIYQLLEDPNGRLWMSSPAGIFSASLKDLNAVADGQSASVAVAAYGLADGMESTQMSDGGDPAGTNLADGRLAFPSVKGLVIIDPRQVRIDKPSAVHVESVLVDDNPVGLQDRLVIPPGHRKLQIDFTACSLLSAGRLSFRYRLRGLSDKWSIAISPRHAQYDNLPPGSYTFEVVAQDGGTPSNISQAAITLIWRPYFYQTAWFYALTALAMCGLAVTGFRLYAGQQRRIYDLRLAERTRVAREMHDTVIQGCVGASTLLEAAAGCAVREAAQMSEFLNRARLQLRLTLDEARQALCDLRHDSFARGLAGALEELGKSVGQEVNLPVEVKMDGDPPLLPEDVSRNLLLIAREAIRNAVAHAEACRIHVFLSFSAMHLRLEIHDDGCGFIADEATFSAHEHFGITGMRERAAQLDGSFALCSQPGAGTSVIVILPITSRRFNLFRASSQSVASGRPANRG